MVQPNGTPEEIPGDNVVGNIIDQVQSEIDLDQSNVVESEVEPFSQAQMAAVQQIVQNATSSYERQVQGLQSLIDRGLNAVRRDTDIRDQETRNMVLNQQYKEQKEAYLNNLDPMQREAVEPIYDQLQQLQRNQVQIAAQQQIYSQNAQPAQDTSNAEWEAVYQHVESFGLNRSDTNIKYDILSNNTLNDSQKKQAFNQMLGDLRVQYALNTQQSSTQTPATQPDPQAQTPPVENSRQGNNGSHNNMDELLDWYLGLGTPNSEQQAYYNQKFEQFS